MYSKIITAVAFSALLAAPAVAGISHVALSHSTHGATVNRSHGALSHSTHGALVHGSHGALVSHTH